MSTQEAGPSAATGASPVIVAPAVPAVDGSNAGTAAAAAAMRRRKRTRTLIIIALALVVLLAVGLPRFIKSLSVVSTDDAFVNGHVTFVAPRVAGQVAKVLVDDNNRVHKGDLLLQLDKEPLQVQVDIAQTAVETAKADVINAKAMARGLVGQARSLRFSLQHSIEDVNNQAALLRAKVAVLNAQKATLAKAQDDYDRGLSLIGSGAIGKEELDQRKQTLLVVQAKIEEALQGVFQVRVGLGLAPKPEKGDDLTQIPPDLDQTFSTVRQAQASLIQAASQLGVSDSFDKSPKQMLEDFYKRDPSGDIDKIYEKILSDAPSIKQAQAKLDQAKSNLEQAKLSLKYCDVYAEVDGVVTRREVNPGNNVVIGQSVMAIRSLTDIWIDANFKETQLSDLRIGQPVDIHIDMYGGSQTFKGRVSGFTMGTGSTLALLPAENATGNFVKVVQRLPVRIDLIDYDPDKVPLFIGLSATPSVHIKQEPAGPDGGKVLQPFIMPSTPAAPAATAPESRP